ncbi:MAG TPA: CinA family nicotinamide mononucleotide deamidase-related protein [Spirochaetia bacterium]|nr:CinA family nicotinamide mononucleotide deamidase-related protein [Spirochaetia bacterium]
MRAEIVMIGTELLLGEIVDTNATKLAKMLREIGLDLYYKTTVGDNEARIAEVLNLALDRSDVVITSGGLGPTVDDVTRQAVADATGRRLVYSRELEKQIAARFRSFGRKMAENNKRQAFIPEGAVPLPNPVGTAPCFLSEDAGGRGFIVSLPGVPRELEYMMTHTVVPLLVERMGGARAIKVRILRSCAVGESDIDRAIPDLMTGDNPTVGLSAHAGQTDIRITAKAATEAEAEALIAPVEASLRERLGVAVYGVENETVAFVVGRLLAEKNLKIGVLDTVTGGGLSRELKEAGYAHVISNEVTLESSADALSRYQTSLGLEETEREAPALLAERMALEGGVGLALLEAGSGDGTIIAVHGPGDIRLTVPGRHFKRESEYTQRWLIIQGLDWVRRAVMGQMTSPVDWRTWNTL